jgi:hypothetical protein
MIERTHRGIRYVITDKGYGILRNHHCPEYFERYFTIEEMRDITIDVMERGIDRMLDHNPVYTGDLRDRKRI